MAEVEKKAVGFPVICHLVAGEIYRWQHLNFLIIYIVQWYKEECTTLQISWAAGP